MSPNRFKYLNKISNKGDGILFFVISLWSKIKNNMVVTSKFDSKGIKGSLVTSLFAAFTLVGGYTMFNRKREFVISLIVVGIAEVVALLIWAIRLKVITVVDQGFEVKYVCLPFLKTFFRFAEFDFYVVEQKGETENFHLLRQGERTVSFSSKEYENYEELKSLLSVVGTKEWSVDYNRAVDSVFKKIPLVMIFFFLILTKIVVQILDTHDSSSPPLF